MSAVYDWGAYGEQGAERLRQQEELAKKQEHRRQEVAQWRARIPAWQDGIKQMDALLEEARARRAAAKAEADTAWEALTKACYVRQRGECARSTEGQPIMDINHPEVAGPKARWDEAQATEQRALLRVSKLEAERQHYETLIGTARGMA